MNSLRLTFWLCLTFWWAAAASGLAGMANDDCLQCHSDKTLTTTNSAGREVSLFVDAAKLAGSVHKTNTCISCHTDLKQEHPDDNVIAKPVDCRRCHTRQSENYGQSVHGVALKAGKATANCQDCHDSHAVVPPTSPASPLHFSKQAETCGGCHDAEAQDYAASVHGKATLAGVRDAPTCTDCHSEHKIESAEGLRAENISRDVCSRCHASERLNTKYRLPADRVQTFFESYHGLASQYGSTTAANCASCHGFHKILPSADPGSTIHKSHLLATCGKCHPGADEKFAQGKVHIAIANAAPTPDLGGTVNWWVRRVYLVLIFVTIGTMLAHNGLQFFKKVRAHLRSSGRPVMRMNRSQRWQHGLLAFNFIVLAVTGFALKYPDSGLAWALGSSEGLRRWLHRGAAVGLLVTGAYHIGYILFTKDGRQLVKDFLPVKKDVTDALTAARHLGGLSRKKAKFGRFGYVEKMEYWAVIWGTIIMGVSGLMLWFKLDVTRWLPRWFVDVALTIHYYEAILACLAILVWHFYHVIFDPDVYPLNMACWDGKVSKHWQKEEHPLDPATPTEVPPAAPAASHLGDNI